jgi:protein-glutamine gamma-glutamyltransferase
MNRAVSARLSFDAEQIAQFAPVIVLLMASALHVAVLPTWCLAALLAAAALRLAIIAGIAPVVSRRRLARAGFALAAFGSLLAVYASFRTLNGLQAGSTLLALMGALKLLESRSRRDELVVLAVALFLLLAACLSSQSLTRAPLYAAVAWSACAAIALGAQRSASQSIWRASRLAGRTLLLALPVAILFFVFFPRIAGQFWALPSGSTATTGLGDEMSPGTIDELIQDYEPAFRVRFESPAPRPSERYWRGPMLTQFDGLTWRRSPGFAYREPAVQLLGEPIRQKVTLEPSNRRRWFALETVGEAPRHDVFLTPDGQLLPREPVTETTSYSTVSYLRSRPQAPLSALGRRINTDLRGARNPRTRKFAAALRARHPDDMAFANAMLEYFRRQGFEYTLEPPRTSLDSVDDFLFESKRGFCGHYASAFATTMRAGGVPARVVTGYLGGEWNPIGGYLIVRHSDAHAWNEVWIDDRGWVRIDPTGVVEPGRLTRGIIDLLPDSVSAPTRLFHDSPWLARMALLWDGTNHWWRERVVEFDLQKQLALLHLGLGEMGWRGLGIALAIGFVAWMLAIAFALRRLLDRRRPDALGILWLAFCAKCARHVPERAANEAALPFATRVAEARPDLRSGALAIASQYNALRFGRNTAGAIDRAALRQLKRAVRSFAA